MINKEEHVRKLIAFLKTIKDKSEIFVLRLPDNLGSIITSGNCLMKRVDRFLK
jgi:hypothetical protein